MNTTALYISPGLGVLVQQTITLTISSPPIVVNGVTSVVTVG